MKRPAPKRQALIFFLVMALCPATFAGEEAADDLELQAVGAQMAEEEAAAPAKQSLAYLEWAEGPRRLMDLGFGVYSFDFSEFLEAPKKSTEFGSLSSLHLGLHQEVADAHFTRLLLDYGLGDTRYDGSLQDGTAYVAQTRNVFANTQVQVGTSLLGNRSDARFQIYTGLGYHLWIRDSSADAAGYREDYSWLYLPLGIRLESRGGGTFDFGFDFSVRASVSGKLKVHLRKFNYQDSNALLGDTYSSRIEVPITIRGVLRQPVMFVPWFEYLEIQQSPKFPLLDANGNFLMLAVEPKSRTFQYGLKINIRLE